MVNMDRDKKLIRKIKKKSDRDAANELISTYYKEVYAYVYKQVMDKELSMDLTQEIFINLLRSLNNYNEKKASFRTWLYKIATYRLVDYYRSKAYKNKDMLISIEDIDLLDNEDLELVVEKKEDVERVISILNNLDILVQQIIRLKIFADYTFLEISKALNIPESTVKTKYYSTIRKIRKNFEEGEYESGYAK